ATKASSPPMATVTAPERRRVTFSLISCLARSISSRTSAAELFASSPSSSPNDSRCMPPLIPVRIVSRICMALPPAQQNAERQTGSARDEQAAARVAMHLLLDVGFDLRRVEVAHIIGGGIQPIGGLIGIAGDRALLPTLLPERIGGFGQLVSYR